MLQACLQSVDLKVDRHFGEVQEAAAPVPITIRSKLLVAMGSSSQLYGAVPRARRRY